MSDNSLRSGTILKSETATYTVIERLGAGGFGITYKASMPTKVGNIATKINVAIKEHFPAADCERDDITSSLTYSNAARDRVNNSLRDFIDEATCLHRLAGLHPNIVNVNEVFRANNTAYYVMEYLDGESLKDYVLRTGPMSAQAMLSVMMPVVEAVATLHNNRFTHLDIKPSNIMLTSDLAGTVRPVLIDFGLAKHYNPDGSATATVASSGFSEGYAPIEQYSGVTTFSPQIDVYSLGATMLFCLTGKIPPRAADLTASALNSLIPAGLDSSLRRLLAFTLAFQASDRLPNANQLYLSLEPIAKKLGVGVDTTVPKVKPVFGSGAVISDDNTRISSNEAYDDGHTIISNPDVYAGDSDTVASSFNNNNDATRLSGNFPPRSDNRRVVSGSDVYVGGNDNTLVDNERYKRQSAKPGTPVWIWVTIVALIVGLAVAITLLLKNDRTPARIDGPGYDYPKIEEGKDVAEAVVEEVAEEPVRASEELSDGEVTPDLGFHFLSGPVKSCTNHWGARIPFDKEGNWTGNYNDNLGPRTFGRDSNGRIVTESYNSSEYGPGTITYTWSGNKVTSMTDDTRGQQVSYTYNPDGSMATQVSFNNGKYITLEFYDERRDSHGNWISRKFRRVADDGYETSTKTGTQKRTITYY